MGRRAPERGPDAPALRHRRRRACRRSRSARCRRWSAGTSMHPRGRGRPRKHGERRGRARRRPPGACAWRREAPQCTARRRVGGVRAARARLRRGQGAAARPWGSAGSAATDGGRAQRCAHMAAPEHQRLLHHGSNTGQGQLCRRERGASTGQPRDAALRDPRLLAAGRRCPCAALQSRPRVGGPAHDETASWLSLRRV